MLTVAYILIIARALLSWFPTSALGPFKRMLDELTEPILIPIRKMIQRSIFGSSNMGIDFSPFIAYLILITLQNYIERYISYGGF